MQLHVYGLLVVWVNSDTCTVYHMNHGSLQCITLIYMPPPQSLEVTVYNPSASPQGLSTRFFDFGVGMYTSAIHLTAMVKSSQIQLL